MRTHQEMLSVKTRGARLYDVTGEIGAVVSRAGVTTGLCVVFCTHTSAGLLVQEHADPNVAKDLEAFYARVAPEGAGYAHQDEGPDDMPSHIKSALARTSETIPVRGGRLALGTWQGLFLAEFRRAAHTRNLVVHVTGE